MKIFLAIPQEVLVALLYMGPAFSSPSQNPDNKGEGEGQGRGQDFVSNPLDHARVTEKYPWAKISGTKYLLEKISTSKYLESKNSKSYYIRE